MKVSFERWGETILGAVVAVVAIGFFAFAAAQAGQTGASEGYDLTARFQRIDGINVGSDVRISGVKVGVVRAVALDNETYLARVTMALNNGVTVPDDSTARIASDGLLGGAYVAIEPGSMDPIPAGGEILNTQGSVDLLTLFSSMAGGSQSNSQNEDTVQ
ncbi:MAG TPA: outer membrane lipid asymmetry maintenance protein MlaD [Candidatus Binatia bacterium]|nr:outer membrane lipid asymmetry maintenance protein MlaD [Candidatus Binatia bacterium]